MNTIERDKTYYETKEYIQGIYFNRCITDELKHEINELYITLTMDNFVEIRKQVKELFFEFESSLLKEQESKSIEEKLRVFPKFYFSMILLGFLVFMIPYSPLYSARKIGNETVLTAWLILLSIFVSTISVLHFFEKRRYDQGYDKIIYVTENVVLILSLATFSLLPPMIASYFGIII